MRGYLWLDANAIEYLCRSGALVQCLAGVRKYYLLATTEFVYLELQEGVKQVPEIHRAIEAIESGDILLIELNAPPLIGMESPLGGLSRADLSLSKCAEYYGGRVLTNDKALAKQLKKEKVYRFCDFLKDAETNNWFESNLVRRLREFAGCR